MFTIVTVEVHSICSMTNDFRTGDTVDRLICKFVIWCDSKITRKK